MQIAFERLLLRLQNIRLVSGDYQYLPNILMRGLVTPSAWLKLSNEAIRQGTSISELIETWAQILEGD